MVTSNEKSRLLYENFKKEKNIHTSAPYSTLLFHPTYPTLSEEEIRPSMLDGFPPLPYEIIDLILSHLTPLDLHAARSTSKTWRSYIMTSSFILKSVFVSGSVANMSHQMAQLLPVDLRLLRRQLDLQIKTARDHFSTRTRPVGAWQVRFRRINLDFSGCQMPTMEASNTQSQPQESELTFLSVCYCKEDDLIVLFVRETAQMGSSSTHINKLEVYHLLQSKRPIHVGSIPYPPGGNKVRYIRSYDDASSSGSRMQRCTEIQVDKDVIRVRYWARNSFGKDEPPFTLEYESLPRTTNESEGPGIRSPNGFDTLDIPRLALREYNEFSEKDNYSSESSEEWELLLDSMIDDKSLASGRYAVIRASLSGKIYVIRFHTFSQPVESYASLIRSIWIITPPTPTSLFQNVAAMRLNIAASVHKTDKMIRAAVIWQDKDTHRPELYVYDVPAEISIPRGVEVRQEHLTAKRVTTLAFNMGGVYAKSPLLNRKSTTSTLTSQHETIGGGLSLVIKDSCRSHSARREVLLWGYSDDNNSNQKSVRFSIYDLMFSEQEMTTTRYRPLNTELHVDLTTTPCACALHDYDYRVVVPRSNFFVARAGPAPHHSFLQRLFGGGSNVSETPGVVTSSPPPDSVTVYDPPARKAALNRTEEGMKELIRYFMQHGMEDRDLLNAWNNAAWSDWGRIPLPDGWRDLREKGEEEEFRIERKRWRMFGWD